ncbi:hypothetical protein KP05_08340 [Cobetia amphilecti]|nr:hypothetical protein KP05_08340 [Cobetia amphilecti]
MDSWALMAGRFANSRKETTTLHLTRFSQLLRRRGDMEGKAQAALCCPACSGLKMEYQYHTPSVDHLVHCQDCHEYVGM